MKKNKFIFLTGCNGQLGRSITKTFKNSNWNVFGLDLKNSSSNICSKFIEGSVKNRDDFKKLFNLSLDLITDKLDVDLCLINNAGISVFTPSEERTYEEFLRVSEVNLFGPILGMTEFFNFHKKIPSEISINSQIINISSIYGLISPNKKIYTDTKRSSSEIYGATKAGLIQMTKYFAARYAESNIRVNCIAPGGVLNKNIQGPDFIKNYSDLVPSKRLCEDKEVAELILSFVSGRFSYVTGQTIPIDGGMTAW